MKYVTFTVEEQAQMFEELSQNFYEANFGQMSKSDIELLMFHFYMQKMVCDSTEEDGTIDYNKCSDYRISQDLGITQQRVRGLKVKNQLTRPIEFDWKKALAKLTQYARYDEKSGMISVNIPDPCLLIEIQNFLEENGSYIEKTLNSKLLRIRAEYYIDIAVALEPEKSREKVIKKIKDNFQEYAKESSVFDDKHIGKSLLEAGVNVTTILSNLSSVLAPELTVTKALISLITN